MTKSYKKNPFVHVSQDTHDKDWRRQSSKSCRRIFNQLEEPLTIKEIRRHRCRCDIWNCPSDGLWGIDQKTIRDFKKKKKDREWYRNYGK